MKDVWPYALARPESLVVLVLSASSTLPVEGRYSAEVGFLEEAVGRQVMRTVRGVCAEPKFQLEQHYQSASSHFLPNMKPSLSAAGSQDSSHGD